ncbi:MAG: tRNA pseudouridine(55) synthase TruB [Gemmatimonadaceae bacterium]|nr:tRNA pseudouridine(55) synthase TruB [Gemmatimonadaceae bacterium]
MDKPAGITSHDVVQLARKTYGQRSVGHLGTLDPFATGLLVLLLGRSTRLARFIEGEPKVYRAVIRFGSETDTDDVTGIVTREASLPSDVSVRAGVEKLTGDILQMPPAYSAKSVEGVRAHDAARRGEPLDLKPCEVTVHRWEIEESGSDKLVASITCGGGTYIRALARDLGRITGSAAHLVELRRTRVGEFRVENAVSTAELVASAPALRALRVVAQ